MSTSTPATASTVRCSPCRKTYTLESLANPRRCPQCGGPTRTASQDEGYRTATESSLESLRSKCLFMMRNLSFGMMGVQILTYVIADRQFAEFVDHFVMITSTISAATTELWAWTRRNFWMVIASVLIQITAILIFFVLVGLMSQFLRGPGVFFIAALPLAGSLAAWRNFGAYTKILRLHQKK